MRLFQISFLTDRSPGDYRGSFRGINDTGPRHEKFTYWDSLFDVGCVVRWENLAIISRRGTGSWVFVIPGTRAGFVRRRNEPAWIAGSTFGYGPWLRHLIPS
jgi:hypothetical protein